MVSAPSRGGFAALGSRPFRIYLIGQTISLIGMWMQQVAQAWIVTRLTGSNSILASINVASSLPILALSLAGGVIADRFDRRRVLIVTQICLAVLAFGFAALVWRGLGHLRIWHIYFMAVLIGMVAAFDLPAQQALVPELVPPSQIPNAIALNQSVFHGSRFIGPSLAGLVMAISVPLAFVSNGISYFAVIVSLLMIQSPPRRAAPSGQSGWAALVEGMRYVRQHAVIGALMGFTALTTTFIFSFLIVFTPMFATHVLHASEGTFALFMTCSGFGAMSGAFAIMVVPSERRGQVLLGGCLAGAAALFIVASSPYIVFALVFITILAFTVALCMGTANTMIQVAVPNELRGRVMGLYSLSFLAVMPFAALGLGLLADQIGLRNTLRGMAIAYALSAGLWLTRARIWNLGKDYSR